MFAMDTMLTRRLDHLKMPRPAAYHEPRAVVFGQQRFEVRGAQLDLLAVGLEDARRCVAALAGSRLRLLHIRSAGRRQVLQQSLVLIHRLACGLR
jgi:hypothetical protein